MEKTFESASHELVGRNSVEGAMFILGEGDGTNQKFYEGELEKFVQGQLDQNRVQLKEWSADRETAWKNEFYLKLLNRLSQEKERLAQQKTKTEKRLQMIKNHESNLRIIAAKQNLSLKMPALPAENSPAIKPAKEEKFLTDEPEPEVYVETGEPTAEEIETAVEAMDGFLKNWLSGGKEEFDSDMASRFKTDKEKNAIRHILSDQIVNFEKIDLGKLEGGLQAKAQEMKKIIRNHKILGLISGMQKDE